MILLDHMIRYKRALRAITDFNLDRAVVNAKLIFKPVSKTMQIFLKERVRPPERGLTLLEVRTCSLPQRESEMRLRLLLMRQLDLGKDRT